MGTQGALVHTTQGGIRYAAYYDQGGPFEDFTGGEATNSCTVQRTVGDRCQEEKLYKIACGQSVTEIRY